ALMTRPLPQAVLTCHYLKEVFMLHRRLILSVIISLLCFTTIFAQATPTKEEQKDRQELEQKALAELDEIITDSQTFRVAENRVIIKAVAADLLWKYDGARARSLIKEAVSSLQEITVMGEDGPDLYRRRNDYMQLRKNIVQAVARHDARFARELLRQTRPPVNAESKAEYDPEDYQERQLESNLMAQIVETDPKQALEMAEENLKKGFSTDLLQPLALLQEKDREAATKLASDILTKLRTENLTTNGEAAKIAFGLLRLTVKKPETDAKPDAKAEPKQETTKDAQPLLDEQGQRDLIELLADAASVNSPRQMEFISALQSLMTEVERLAPARAAQLRRKVSTGSNESGLSDSELSDPALYSKLDNASAEEILAAAPNAPPEMREYVYQRAVAKFSERGDLERARKVINENITNPQERKRMLAEIDRQVLALAASQGKMEETRKMLSTLRSNEERASTLAQLAMALSEKDDKKSALKLLDEAREMVGGRARNPKQLMAQLMVAQGYSVVEPSRSFPILESVVDQLNDLVAAGAVLASFLDEDGEMMKDEEIKIGSLNGLVKSSVMQYAGEVTELARKDFDKTMIAANRFQRPELRVMAHLLIVQSVLQPQKNKEMQGGLTAITTRPEIID
ncbi:MAG: hypothetical protein WBP93_08200, partial [Pyrinomonadaceae bacterium]